MADDPKIKPVKRYERPKYPHKDSQKGKAAKWSLGKKLGVVIVAGVCGAALIRGCGGGSNKWLPNGGVTGPPPVRPDFKTEDDAKKQIGGQTKKEAGAEQKSIINAPAEKGDKSTSP